MVDQKPTERDAVAKHYGNVDHPAGPTIYTRADMHDAIFDLGQFRALPRDRVNRLVDLMSGVKCLVASEVKKRAQAENIPLDVYCFDVAFDAMDPAKRAELEDQYSRLSTGDITRGIDYHDKLFDRAAVRFGIKNYPTDQQLGILWEVRRILLDGGIFVLADMIAPETSYDWMQQERRRKSRHTVGEQNAHHHIPTLDEWFDMLSYCHLFPNRDDVYKTESHVTTTNWVTSKQMGEEGMRDMNDFLLSAPEQARKDFNIREEEVDGKKVVKIDYPVVVIGAKAD